MLALYNGQSSFHATFSIGSHQHYNNVAKVTPPKMNGPYIDDIFLSVQCIDDKIQSEWYNDIICDYLT